MRNPSVDQPTWSSSANAADSTTARVEPRLQRGGDRLQGCHHLAVDDDGIQALFAAEVLIDDGLTHPRFRRDLLDCGGLEATWRRTLPAHVDSCSRRSLPVIRARRLGEHLSMEVCVRVPGGMPCARHPCDG